MSDGLPDLAALKAGDGDAWERAFRRLWPLAVGLASKVGVNHPDAENAASQALIELAKGISRIRNHEQLVGTLCMTAKQRALDIKSREEAGKRNKNITVSIEARQAETGQEFGPASSDLPPGMEGPDDEETRKCALLYLLLGRLRELPRRLIIGAYLLEKTTRELAAENGLNEGAVRVYICRGLKELGR